MKRLMTIVCGAMMIACGGNVSNVGNWSDERIEEWCESSEWFSELPMKVDGQTDRRRFVEQNVLNPEAWRAAYGFLTRSDLAVLPEGSYTLDDNGTFATVAEYDTKEDARFEAHEKYIDIQYVMSGRERIDIAAPEAEKSGRTPYDEERDIEFFDAEDYRSVEANSANIVVLFPNDGHRPCMNLDGTERVRKIVVKIPYKEI